MALFSVQTQIQGFEAPEILQAYVIQLQKDTSFDFSSFLYYADRRLGIQNRRLGQ